jgi:hypothetical protein
LFALKARKSIKDVGGIDRYMALTLAVFALSPWPSQELRGTMQR